MAKQEQPSPQDMYSDHLGQATKKVLGVKQQHDKAGVKAYASIAGKFEKVDPKDHKAVYGLLKDAVIAYKRAVGILDPKAKPNDEFEMGEVIQALRSRGIDPADVVNDFQSGEGRKVIERLMEHYQSTHIRGAHAAWYHDKVGMDYGKRATLAKGYKTHHKSKQHEARIAEDLEDKILQQAVSQAGQ